MLSGCSGLSGAGCVTSRSTTFSYANGRWNLRGNLDCMGVRVRVRGGEGGEGLQR